MYILVPSVSISVFFWAGRGGEGGGGVSHHGKNKIKFNVKGTKDFLGKDEPQLLFLRKNWLKSSYLDNLVPGQLPKQSGTLKKNLLSCLTPLAKFGSFCLWMTASPPTAQD
jgi:hypothetical protein